ncbi:MAG: hypothetical protein K0S74_1351 [Chlamydiales bacterium]|jgi:hypothetical protein|nr:hypothetical protein [Chlamydiales bacterium]
MDIGNMTAGIKVQLFVGCLLTSELKLQLSLSQNWKQDKLFPANDKDSIKEIRYKEKEYVGFLLDAPKVSLRETEAKLKKLQIQLSDYCESLEPEQFKAYLLPQIFLV